MALIHPEGTTKVSDIFEGIQSFRFSIYNEKFKFVNIQENWRHWQQNNILNKI